MAKLNVKKQKKSSFYEEKSLVGLTLVLDHSLDGNNLLVMFIWFMLKVERVV
jgi:hypothetical protein